MPPHLGDRAYTGGPQAEQGRCLVMCSLQTSAHAVSASIPCHALLCHRTGSSASPSPAAPQGRIWLRQAGSGTCKWQGKYPVSLHGLAGICTAVLWDCTGLSCPILRLVPPLLAGELPRPVKAGFCPQHRFSPAMQINLLVTKKCDLIDALHHLHMSELLGFLPSFSFC